MELFTATGKLKKLFWQLEIFEVCTTGDMAHIDTPFKFLRHTCQHGRIDVLHCYNDMCLQPQRGHVAMVGHTSTSKHGSLQQWRIPIHPCWRVCGKNLNIVSICAVSPVVHISKNSVKVSPLVFLLYMCVNTENIMKRPVLLMLGTNFIEQCNGIWYLASPYFI
jgi:hypothetical protein